ncbi:UNVERIFIED_CONTAM: hypothetical protein PYX00_010350 [Menopon gallinae]|uniref:Uncharacterized protein n=1 Tax=Menopon gallinae TaxID=328185 RepID=A0AAW2HEV9_9NEOP
MLDGPQALVEPRSAYPAPLRFKEDDEMSELNQNESSDPNDPKPEVKENPLSNGQQESHSRHHSPVGNNRENHGSISRTQSPVRSRASLGQRDKEEDYDSEDSREGNTSRETVLPAGESRLRNRD